MRSSGAFWKSCGHGCGGRTSGRDQSVSEKGGAGPAACSFCFSSGCLSAVRSVRGGYGVGLGPDSRGKAEQADASGSHPGRRGIFSETEKTFPHPFPSVRGGGRACRKRAEGAEKGSARRRTFPDPFFSGVHSDGERAFSVPAQYSDHLLGQVSERLGCDGYGEEYADRSLWKNGGAFPDPFPFRRPGCAGLSESAGAAASDGCSGPPREE